MIAFITLCMVVLPGMLLVLICGLIEWLIGKLDKQDKLLGWYAGDTLGNARTVKEAQRRKAGCMGLREIIKISRAALVTTFWLEKSITSAGCSIRLVSTAT